MKNFELTPDMLTMGGTFYPKGYAFIMFPQAAQAQSVAAEIEKISNEDEPVLFLDAATILRDIGKVAGQSDLDLPSIGTERATVRKYIDLANEGQCALMIKVHSDKETERIMQAARRAPFSYGQRYHLLVIEDLE